VSRIFGVIALLGSNPDWDAGKNIAHLCKFDPFKTLRARVRLLRCRPSAFPAARDQLAPFWSNAGTVGSRPNKPFSRMTTVEQRIARMEPSRKFVTTLIRTARINFPEAECSFLA
jgi:hypothetical protein